MSNAIYLGRAKDYWRALISSLNPIPETAPRPATSNAPAEEVLLWTDAQTNPDRLALSSVDGRAIPLFIELLDDPEWWVRHFALGMLAQHGPDAAVAVDAILPILLEPHSLNQRQAADTSAAIGSAAGKAIPVLTSLLADEAVSEWAANAIAVIRSASAGRSQSR